MIKTGYKKTGVLIVDKVEACIDHYEKQGKTLRQITLDFGHWAIFKNYAITIAPDCMNEDESIDLDGVEVRRGSSLQSTDMYWDFKTKGEA
jgi:hypothetical protein